MRDRTVKSRPPGEHPTRLDRGRPGSPTPSPVFSVIVPTFGRPEYLQEALESVVAQSCTDLECIVGDDASPTPPIAFKDPRIGVIRREENCGPAAARNTGLAEARGQFVVFLADDDRYTHDRLEIALEGLTRAPLALCWSAHLGRSNREQRRLEGRVHGEILDTTTPHLGTVEISRSLMQPFMRTTSRLRTSSGGCGSLGRPASPPSLVSGIW